MSFVLRHAVPALAVAMAAAFSSHALRAQTAPGTPGAPLVHQAPGGIEWMSGGAGEEERAAMSSRSGQLPFRLVLSGAAGEYVVAERIVVRSAQGEALVLRDAGPIVMMKLPAGRYTVEATVNGRTEERPIRIGAGPRTLEWRWPAS